ncbi:NACHT domain-containing protein [Pedobacter hiemivivus]|uniref:hypothetical protein n=1 Tax=Pedobacter hiemivivus TaxID=2530454 RepID=UPI00197FFEBF|nr:hypothetical protein [Pedobacter hiemivivus]
MDETSILNELKGLILIKTGIRTATPADCKRISIEISRALNKHVSETTIKRLFGFAAVKHNFSKFTIATLTEYVSGEILDSWPIAISLQPGAPPATWGDIRYRVSKVSDFTLKGIKNRVGMPYELTISRKFAEHDFEEFLKSSYSFTAFVSQPGYGKTILMCHLAEKFFHNPNTAFYDSSILFLQAYNFFNAENPNLNFEDQLKTLLNIPKKESLINFIQENYKNTKSKFVIFIDGFSELTLKKDLKKQLFDSLINFICAIEDIECIKLVMSMRSTYWIRFYELIRHSAYLKSKWFAGNYFNVSEISNVPPLTEKEVDLIVAKIDGKAVTEINPKLKAQLKLPFHIQLYYQLKQEDPCFNYSTNITFHELISRFIQENIYRSNYYTEKILFLKKVIQLTDFGKNGASVPKDNLIAELSAFKNAYMELLSDGILIEEKQYEDYHPREFVRFIHAHTFEYFLFIEILEKFNLRVEEDFFQYIQNEHQNNSARFQLLQWAIRFIIRIGDLKSLRYVFDLPLNHLEHNYLILFIAENLKYRSKYSADTNHLIKEHKLHDKIVEQLINFDFIDTSFKEALEVLVEISDAEEHTLVYQSLLAVMDILSLDEARINARMEKIQDLGPSDWVVDPFEVIQLVHAKITNKNISNSQLSVQIENLSYPFLKDSKALNTQQGIVYLMALVLNLFYGSDQGAIKMINTIIKLHPKEFTRRSAFTIFIMNMLAISRSRITPGKKTEQLIRILGVVHENKHRYKVTQYSAAILKMAQAHQLRNRGEYLLARDYCEGCIDLFKTHHLNYNCIEMYNLLIAIFSDLNSIDRINECKYERLTFIDENKFSRKILPLPREHTDFNHH